MPNLPSMTHAPSPRNHNYGFTGEVLAKSGSLAYKEKQGISWENHGSSWGKPWDFMGKPWDVMGKPWDFMGILWLIMVNDGGFE